MMIINNARRHKGHREIQVREGGTRNLRSSHAHERRSGARIVHPCARNLYDVPKVHVHRHNGLCARSTVEQY